MPGLTKEWVEDMTEVYDEDLARIQKFPGSGDPAVSEARAGDR